jgi:hypothetical protein
MVMAILALICLHKIAQLLLMLCESSRRACCLTGDSIAAVNGFGGAAKRNICIMRVPARSRERQP